MLSLQSKPELQPISIYAEKIICCLAFVLITHTEMEIKL